jgi:CheY-like chemotaxis protein
MTLSWPIGASRALMAMGAHVVVLDVMMPSIRGDKLARLLRKNPRLSQLGIVLVSGLEPAELNDVSGELSSAQVVAKRSLEVQLGTAVVNACRRCRD